MGKERQGNARRKETYTRKKKQEMKRQDDSGQKLKHFNFFENWVRHLTNCFSFEEIGLSVVVQRKRHNGKA